MTTTDNTAPDFAALLESATCEPGRLSTAYTAFHSYSLGNMLAALGQCADREIPLGPIASYAKWQALGRQVRKGEKAIALCQPVTIKRRTTDDEQPDAAPETVTRFVWRRSWFVLSQTDGQPYEAAAPPAWDKTRALAALTITEIPFELVDGNCQGYATGRSVAINPVAAAPFKTLFHEIAHVLIGHTSEGALHDDDRTPRNLRELEAEGAAMLVCAALGLPGIEESRAYMQHWYGAGQPVPEASARRIFKAADAILKAGKPAPTTEAE